MAVPVTMMADDPVEINGIYYNLITKAKIAKVTRNPNVYYNGYSGDIVIPFTVHYDNVDYSVKEIEGYAFERCSGLTSIDIPNSVTSIGAAAFYGCSGLTSITIPNSVTSIGEIAFSGCSGLTSITIPNSVTSIYGSAFSGCSGLISIDVDANNTIYDSRDNCNAIIETSTNSLISGCKNTAIPNSVTSIGSYAFSGCTGLTSIDIPNSVTSIGSYAFRECSCLTSIDIPNSVTSIGVSAFSGCSGLTSINIPDGVTSISDCAFSGCSGLTSIDIPDGVTSIGSSAFRGCSGLTSIDIPDGVTSIGSSAFRECSCLTSINIPNSVTSIGESAFEDCTGLTSITIPNGVTNIGLYAFNNCRPSFLEYHTNCDIHYYTYQDREIGIYPDELETLVIGDEVTSLYTFLYSGRLKNLKRITIGAGITEITYHNYYDYFKNCPNLEVVTCRATTPPTGSSTAFDGSYIEYATLIVPDEAYNAYSTTEPWSNFGTILKASQISTVTAKDFTREYGDANPSEWEYTVVGQALDGTPNRICDADETSAPGEYPIVISQGTETNTNVTYVNGTLTSTKAPLTITANSYTIKEGEALPSYDAVFTGLKNSESKSVVSPVVSCTATDSNTPGTYPITVTASSDNYDITTVAGTLTILPTKMSITIGAPGVGTYCSPYDLDFSTVTDFKAYIATGYNSATGNVIVQAVKDVPAGTGLFLKGTPGTYDVPCGESSSYYVNMLVGVTEATTISATDGNMTNFLLSATNSSDACFRPISSTYNLKANRAYLQIPTSMVSSSAGANAVGIEFEEGVTGIDNSLSDMDANAHWFTLDGSRLNGKPTQKGIYVVNGQKVVIK